MDWPSFTIVMPTFQRRDVVCGAVEALGRVSYPGRIEAIVVVDGSTDGTGEALSGIDLPFPLRVILQPNGGASSARNHGAREASGDILLFLDDDMMVDPAIVEHHARSYAEGADAVLGDIPIDPDAPATFLSEAVAIWAVERRQRLIETGELTLFDLLTGQLSIRRSVFEGLGGFDGDFTRDGTFGNEDIDIGVRLLENASVVFNPDAISYQRYVVGYRLNMRQWFEAGMADVGFARKHPRHAAALFDLHGKSRWHARLVLIPLSRLPGLASCLAWLMCRLAALVEGGPARVRHAVGWWFFRTRDLLYWRGVHRAGGMPGNHDLLVLCYHAIADLSSDPVLRPYAVPPDQFRHHVTSLLRRGYRFVSGDEVAAYLRQEAGLPRRPILLTFDDCYEDLLTVAAPFLSEHSVPAIAFAVTGLATNSNEWDHRNGTTRLRLLEDDELQKAVGLGVEIGAHSRTHRNLMELDPADLREETDGAAADIAAIGLPRPRFFAYPFGQADRKTRQSVSDAGFRGGFGLVPGRFASGMDPTAIPRVEILRQDHGLRFWLKTAMPLFAEFLFHRKEYRDLLR